MTNDTLADAWRKRAKLWAEGERLWAEGYELRAEGDKLRTEGYKLWADAVKTAHGEITIEWRYRDDGGYDCVLGNGDAYKADEICEAQAATPSLSPLLKDAAVRQAVIDRDAALATVASQAAEIARLTKERDAYKILSDQHADGLRGILQMARAEVPDIKRIILWCSDSLSGYTESLETTTLTLSDERNAARERAHRCEQQIAEQAAEIARLTARLAEVERERDNIAADWKATAASIEETLRVDNRYCNLMELQLQAERIAELLAEIVSLTKSRDRMAAEIARLSKQLPDGMEDCTIELVWCPVGHARLLASNWIDNGCSACKSAELLARIAELEETLRVDARIAELQEILRVDNRYGNLMELELQAERIAALQAKVEAQAAELDEVSPMQRCARCGTRDRAHRMVIEEGDEWECQQCWERCNAQEKAEALAARETEQQT